MHGCVPCVAGSAADPAHFGANLPFAKLADEAERWLDKPVLQINATTYWHALRTNGITDKVWGYGSLLTRF